eukprot:8044968-Pyramimonas_sp.AAC.1
MSARDLSVLDRLRVAVYYSSLRSSRVLSKTKAKHLNILYVCVTVILVLISFLVARLWADLPTRGQWVWCGGVTSTSASFVARGYAGACSSHLAFLFH